MASGAAQEIPEAHIPEAHIPEGEIPEAHVPEAHISAADVSNGVVPEAHCVVTPLELVKTAGADGVVHDKRKSARPLLAHLQGTEDLLKQGGYPPHVATAGLLHSIYGTNKFTIMTVDPNKPGERERVQASAGHEAERLAWLFCSIQRPACLHKVLVQGQEQPLGDVVALEGRVGTVNVTNAEFSSLVAIEIANLLEQGEYRPDQWPLFQATGHWPRIADAKKQLRGSYFGRCAVH